MGSLIRIDVRLGIIVLFDCDGAGGGGDDEEGD